MELHNRKPAVPSLPKIELQQQKMLDNFVQVRILAILKLLYFQPILVKTKVKFRKNVKMNMLVQTLQNLKFILPLLA